MTPNKLATAASDGRAVAYEFLFCLSFGVFLAADGWPAVIAASIFGLFFTLYLGRLIELERGER